MSRLVLTFGVVAAGLAFPSGRSLAQSSLPGPSVVPSALVTANTKQVYRFHFSGLQSADAIRLANKIHPFLTKLPAENPLRKAVVQAKDAASFADDYRSLRSLFLESGIDTIYYFAEAHWIESTTLPGFVVMPGTPATLDRLRKRLDAAGHADWAQFLSGFRSAKGATGWMMCAQGSPTPAGPSAARAVVVERAFKNSLPIRSAAITTRQLPALQVSFNDTTPLTVVNLERNQLDIVVSQVMMALVPSAARTAQLVDRAEATSVAAIVHPFPAIVQVAHMRKPKEAAALAAEINKTIKGTMRKISNLDDDIGPLIALFASTTMLVSAQGSDVVMVMKPPILFDAGMAQQAVREAQHQDWTALTPPAGYHWELVGALGTTSRHDVFDRIASVRPRGGAPVAPTKAAGGAAAFRIPVNDVTVGMSRDARGNLKIDPLGKGDKSPALPALELLDDRNRVVAVLRLDLTPGDPRFDLARTHAVVANRKAERAAMERMAKKQLDDVENEEARLRLEKKLFDFKLFKIWEDKVRNQRRHHANQQGAVALLEDLEKKVADLQLRHPGTTIVRDGDEIAGGVHPLAAKHKQYRFAGQWLFDYGLLTLHQDAKGYVAGAFTIHGSSAPLAQLASRTELVRTAIASGKIEGATLKLTLFDTTGKSRTVKFTLDADGLGGRWFGDAAIVLDRPIAKTTPKGKGAAPVGGDGGTTFGRIDRIDSGAPEADWFQEAPGDFAGYWTHATRKEYNTLLKPLGPGTLQGNSGWGPGLGSSNIVGAAAGKLAFVIQAPGAHGSKVHEAVLSADGQTLTFDGPRKGARNSTGLFGSNQNKGIELTRQSK